MPEAPALTVYDAVSPYAALVLAHGAGAGQSSPFMMRFARGMADRGLQTATFDFPYMSAGRKSPDPPPVLEACWRAAIDSARRQLGEMRLVIGGKSMGGRIASHVAARGCPGLAGLVFLGYPLHPPGKPDQRRDTHLPRIAEPMLFVQGTRDAFGTSADIRLLLPSLQKATLHEVVGGDHSFKLTRRADVSPDDVMRDVMEVVDRWMRQSI